MTTPHVKELRDVVASSLYFFNAEMVDTRPKQQQEVINGSAQSIINEVVESIEGRLPQDKTELWSEPIPMLKETGSTSGELGVSRLKVNDQKYMDGYNQALEDVRQQLNRYKELK